MFKNQSGLRTCFSGHTMRLEQAPKVPMFYRVINEGIAGDARLVKSASRPMSSDDLRQMKDKRDTPDGTRDANGKPLKVSRDLESD